MAFKQAEMCSDFSRLARQHNYSSVDLHSTNWWINCNLSRELAFQCHWCLQLKAMESFETNRFIDEKNSHWDFQVAAEKTVWVSTGWLIGSLGHLTCSPPFYGSNFELQSFSGTFRTKSFSGLKPLASHRKFLAMMGNSERSTSNSPRLGSL